MTDVGLVRWFVGPLVDSLLVGDELIGQVKHVRWKEHRAVVFSGIETIELGVEADAKKARELVEAER